MPLRDSNLQDVRIGVTVANGATGANAIRVRGGLRNVECYAHVESPTITTTTAIGTLTYNVSTSPDGVTYTEIATGVTANIPIGTNAPGHDPVRIPFIPTNDDSYVKIGLKTITGLTLTTLSMTSSIVFQEP
jgi:hypothetical protein